MSLGVLGKVALAQVLVGRVIVDDENAHRITVTRGRSLYKPGIFDNRCSHTVFVGRYGQN